MFAEILGKSIFYIKGLGWEREGVTPRAPLASWLLEMRKNLKYVQLDKWLHFIQMDVQHFETTRRRYCTQ